MSDAPFHLVLLAGGRGTRFWPASRAARPKQFLSFGGGASLLRQTFERFGAPGDNTLVVAPRDYLALVRAELPEVPPDGLLVEPSARDTAAAVGLACLAIRRRDPKGIIVVSPTDHRVSDREAFLAALAIALDRAKAGGLGTLGVKPDRPATEFGYLETSGVLAEPGPVAVSRFVEKPDLPTAAAFVAGRRHLWNAGLFVFRVDVFFDEGTRVAPALIAGLEKFDLTRSVEDPSPSRSAWDALPKLSLDYALMEKAGDVWTVPLDAGWDDLGGWNAVARLLPRDTDGNAASCEGMFIGARDCTLIGAGDGRGSGGPLTVLVGVSGLTIVQAGDVTLVCRTERAGLVKEAVERLQAADRGDLL